MASIGEMCAMGNRKQVGKIQITWSQGKIPGLESIANELGEDKVDVGFGKWCKFFDGEEETLKWVTDKELFQFLFHNRNHSSSLELALKSDVW